MSKKEFLLDYLLYILLELVCLFALMGFCALFIYRGELIGEQKMIAGEMTSPTVGRLIYFILSSLLAVSLCIASSIFARKEKDVLSFWLAFASGILLWQAIGEEAWHFSVGGINFVRLESIAAFPLVIVFIGLLIYGFKNKPFNWGIWITIISFACNWLGHYITIGIYPFFENLIEAKLWNILAGSIGGAIVFVLSILYLIKKGTTKKERIFASVLTFIAIGIVALSIFA